MTSDEGRGEPMLGNSERWRSLKEQTVGMRFPSDELQSSTEGMVAAVKMLRVIRQELREGMVRTRLRSEAGRARRERIDLEVAGVVSVGRLIDSLEQVTFDACTAWTVELEARELELDSYHPRRFVRYFEEFEELVFQAQVHRCGFGLLDGLIDPDQCAVGAFAGASVHESFAHFAYAALGRVAASIADACGSRPTQVVNPPRLLEPRPGSGSGRQVGRPEPSSPEELEADDRAILISLGESPKQAKVLSADLLSTHQIKRATSYVYKRMRDLKVWGLVSKECGAYSLSGVGRQWARRLRDA